MNEDKRYAVLIDAENISPKYIQVIFDEVSNYGVSTYRRIYGDWTSTRNNRWKEVLLDNSITPIQQYSYTEGKNSSDSAMIIDAMDILYTLSVEGFVLVSSDSDFTRLASRLRESGMSVIGMGESKTPSAFISACNTFKYLDILYAAAQNARDDDDAADAAEAKAEPRVLTSATRSGHRRSRARAEKAEATALATSAAGHRDANATPSPTELALEQNATSSTGSASENGATESGAEESRAHCRTQTGDADRKEGRRRGSEKAKTLPRPQTTIGAVRRALRNIVRENSDEENWISLANLGNQLTKRFPDFDVRNYGHAKLVTFIESFHEFEVAMRPTSGASKQLFVRLIE
ncbi:MAG: NYN domain-containing protein [Peptoniphilaceae bacterium]|nr:NYN domain-containing protein [Peptoniphilaceae bacterium]